MDCGRCRGAVVYARFPLESKAEEAVARRAQACCTPTGDPFQAPPATSSLPPALLAHPHPASKGPANPAGSCEGGRSSRIAQRPLGPCNGRRHAPVSAGKRLFTHRTAGSQTFDVVGAGSSSVATGTCAAATGQGPRPGCYRSQRDVRLASCREGFRKPIICIQETRENQSPLPAFRTNSGLVSAGCNGSRAAPCEARRLKN